MSSTGAIPKVRGARPKTKPNQITPKLGDNEKNLREDSSCKGDLGGEPLDKKEVVAFINSIQVKRSALHSDWIENKTYLHFSMPPQPSEDGSFIPGAIDAWLEQIEFLKNDLIWLLNLPHHKFWSQMVYDTQLQLCLESYLSGRSRWYEEDHSDSQCKIVLATIHRLILLVYIRIATFKESKENHITPSSFGDLIYNHFLFDTCKLLDLSILYGASNTALLQKMFSNIFTHQPKYFHDLSEFVSSLKKVLDDIESRLGLTELSIALAFESRGKLSFEEICDTVDYLVDVFLSLSSFLNLYPVVSNIFRKGSFDVRLSMFYEKAIPFLSEKVADFEDAVQNGIFIQKTLQKIHLIRSTVLSTFRNIIYNSIILPMSERKSNSSSSIKTEECVEQFVNIFITCVEEKIFITDYSSMHDIADDIKIFQNSGADMTTLNFVNEAVSTVISEVKSSLSLEDLNTEEESTSNTKNKESDPSGMSGYYASENNQMNEFDEACLIFGVHNLLPDLGTAFIRECLKYYNYSSEEVLNALLENNLPPSLSSLDRTLDIEKSNTDTFEPPPPVKEVKTKSEEEPLFVRSNVYEDDEFDVFSRKAKISHDKIHKGKKTVHFEKDISINEKVKELGYRYESNLGCSIYDDTELKYNPITVADYDDEYDDTYDDNDAGDIDNFTADKKAHRAHNIRGTGAINVPGIDFAEDQDANEEELRSERLGDGAQKGPSFKGSEEIREISGNFRRQHNYQPKLNKKPIKTNPIVIENSRYRRRFPPRENGQSDAQNAEASEKVEEDQETKKPAYQPFCDNPEEMRRRDEERRRSKMERKRNYNYAPRTSARDDAGYNNTSYPKGGSYKGTRSGPKGGGGSQGNEEANGARSNAKGTHKEDSNSQDSSGYRYKNAHKNQYKRQAAQAKYRNNF